ncbi:tRNA (guanosine(37)-N1)-methyltransferase TrmD [Actinomyces viscosus]|uniref:tRNA (guanosine(37)-N1)-methyltransferase TrmD n=1 Tax=Actinomyces viscosus TaxID=1656 RepID=UPI0028E5628A|nr:tRNA (guanosine(37)-N1)-methyltransferase TrmD [Actinomyces viscosus]
MRIDVVTIFPDYLKVLDLSLIGRAAGRGSLDLHVHDLRDHAHDRHRTVDDTPLGGGAGMVMKPDVWGEALDDVLAMGSPAGRQVLIIPTPSGEVFTQRTAEDLAGADSLVFACGRYEGIDARVPEHYASRGVEVRELSIGDYVLNGGEVAAIVMIEAIARLLPGVLGNPESLVEESHSAAGLLEYPVHTRPTRWRDLEVDPVLLSGDHARIARTRRDQAIARTVGRRPDMVVRLDAEHLDRQDRAALAASGWAVPAGAAHPVPVRIRPATAHDAEALADLAARTFPDACGHVIDPEFIDRHITTNLVPDLFRNWADDERVDLVVAERLAPLPAPRASGGTETAEAPVAPDLVGYAAVLREEPDDAGEPPTGIDPRPASVQARPGQVVGELSKVYVDSTMRGSGLTPALMSAVMQQAAEHGTSLFWLGTHVTNKRAQKAYKRAGFRQVGTRTYNVGGQDAHDVVMIRRTGEGL